MNPIFDAHFHIIDPRFPLKRNRGFLPDPFPFNEYMKRAKELNIKGGAIVSASYQGYDQTYLMEALEKLGPNFVGVTQLPKDTTDEEILKLSRHGVRAIRFNIYNGLSADPDYLERLANRVYDLANWHVELHIASPSLNGIAALIKRLPAVIIDHLGLEEEGQSELFELVDHGVRVKASGFGRVDFNIKQTLKSIYSVNPEALLFGTDLPSTRAKRPFQVEDIELIYEVLGEKGAENVLFSNAQKWYMKK
ncbi:amidohydrolase family protein [Alkalihalobacillus deserti]|uniref:amidohydrolase family protein n=1 Tax=Alkalihalobacillus deserti TaxID=2879466 RepID=UPI001D134276|nr:amidohydrolase family protein [Alkalihalobacillus deserti]